MLKLGNSQTNNLRHLYKELKMTSFTEFFITIQLT